MTTGKLVQNAIIMTLSSSMTFPKPTPPGQPKPPSGGEHPDHTLPGDLPHPEHPIYFPLPPGAPVDPEYGIPEEGLPHPDHTLPGPQPHPEHPIVLPPDPPEQGGGWGPIYIWGGGPGARPPIAIPPDGSLPIEPGKPPVEVKFKAIWTPENGWQTIAVVVPGGPHVTPSKKR